MLQRTFDRVCIWCSIPCYSERADRLVRHLTRQFRRGLSDETALFETAMWLEKNADASNTARTLSAPKNGYISEGLLTIILADWGRALMGLMEWSLLHSIDPLGYS